MKRAVLSPGNFTNCVDVESAVGQGIRNME
jgi:hypothetical protein